VNAETPGFFVVMATDRPGSLALREQLRPTHREWLRNHPGHDVAVLHGGPTLGGDGKMNGTVLIIQAQNLQQARRFVEADPYSVGALFAEVVIRPWRWSLGQPEQPNLTTNA
jgi:uncharacterized protein YciI